MRRLVAAACCPVALNDCPPLRAHRPGPGAHALALTGGCTKQGCSLRDATADLKKHGVTVVGVSTDSVEKQAEFKKVNNFPYALLADTDKKVVKAFGQSGTLVASREAYLIDRAGKIVYRDEKQTDKQAEKVLAFLASKKS